MPTGGGLSITGLPIRDAKIRTISQAIQRGTSRAATRALVRGVYGSGFSNQLFADIRRDILDARSVGDSLLRPGRPVSQPIRMSRIPTVESPTRKKGFNYRSTIQARNPTTGETRTLHINITDSDRHRPSVARFQELLSEVLDQLESAGSQLEDVAVSSLQVYNIVD